MSAATCTKPINAATDNTRGTMFTGIITDIGEVQSVTKNGDTRIQIATAFDTSAIDIGASICCSGACMTVVEKVPGVFDIEASAESISKTTLGGWGVGTRINLERALKAGDELGGHIVSGHVDGTARLSKVSGEGDSLRLSFVVADDLARFIAPKGSITLDGVSLTVNEVEGPEFGINLIPHTQQSTTLGKLSVDDVVNVEIDMLARYVARLLE